MHRKRPILIALAFFVLAGTLLAYPWVSSLLSEKYHSDVETAYCTAMDSTSKQDLELKRQQAVAYNQMLRSSIYEGEALASSLSYEELLNTGGIMGYVDIPKISVYLPICHGTDAETLEQAVGHVLGSSLPVGGENTHSVLSAHSGIASAKLFSDIENLDMGDIFYIHVLEDTLAYQVDAINTVLPSDISNLQIEDDHDYVTLATCTPFGVNTHRLLVRGTRVPLEIAQEEVSQIGPATSSWSQHYLSGLAAGASLLIVLIAVYLLAGRRKRHA